jgi:hypothetical protein
MNERTNNDDMKMTRQKRAQVKRASKLDNQSGAP